MTCRVRALSRSQLVFAAAAAWAAAGCSARMTTPAAADGAPMPSSGDVASPGDDGGVADGATPVTPPDASPPAAPPPAGLDKFDAVMIDDTVNTPASDGSYGGGYWCATEAVGSPVSDPATLLDMVYYDAARVFYQIADYTHDAKWTACAKRAVELYRDGYLAPNNDGAAGWQIFPKGLYMDWQRTKDDKSRQALIGLAANSAFAQPVPTSWVPGLGTIREMSYNLNAKLYANDAGESLDYSFQLNRLRLYFQQALVLLKGDVPSGNLAPDPLGPGDLYVRPFMIGIGCEALIEYYSRTGDKSVLALIQPVLELMWQQSYVPAAGAMLYTNPMANGGCPADNSDFCPSQPAPVLNMLIAPAYMWVFHMTGDPTWRDRADALFDGVANATYQTALLYTPAGKAFDQVYKWFPDFFAWRK